MSRPTPEEEPLLKIAAPKEEWQAVERLLTTYDRQCKQMQHASPLLVRLQRFQQELARAIGQPHPMDDTIERR